jgi:hypothetical protein
MDKIIEDRMLNLLHLKKMVIVYFWKKGRSLMQN